MKVYPQGAIKTLYALGTIVTRAHNTKKSQVLWEVTSSGNTLWKLEIPPSSTIVNNTLIGINWYVGNFSITNSSYPIIHITDEEHPIFLFENYWYALAHQMRIKAKQAA